MKPEGKAAHSTTTVFLTSDLSRQHDDSMLSLVRNTVILKFFHAADWVTGRAGHPAYKKYYYYNPQKFTAGDQPYLK